MKQFLQSRISKALLFFTLSFFLPNTTIFSQNFVWAKGWGGLGYDDGRSIAIDPSGNVICAGSFSGTADFDPNGGTFNMTASGTGSDVYIVKLTSAGNLVWAKQIGISGQSETASGLDIDAAGNIHVVGSFYGTTDFNPGAGVNNLVSAGANDIYVLKLDNNGNYIWAGRAGSTAAAFPNPIDLDAAGGIYVTGQVSGVADLDPSAATYTEAAIGGQDVFAFKWTSAGAFVWGCNFGGTLGDQGSDIKVNNAGTSVYITGYFAGTGVDLSPFCSCTPVNSTGGSDIFVVKLTAASPGFQAKAIMGGTTGDSGAGIDLDAADNVYITGGFTGLSDMDPGAALAQLAELGGGDGFVTKLISNLLLFLQTI
ncbi:MAG: SBBP repeat-containing protein [Sphingobacteriaceae bacterium]|nr:SBBP repeat-containing protein [Sphingobacteriaceae bacterium]